MPGNFLRVTLRRTLRNSAVKHTPFVVREGARRGNHFGSVGARFTTEISGKNEASFGPESATGISPENRAPGSEPEPKSGGRNQI